MSLIKITSSGKIITKGGKPSCACCEVFEMSIKYTWASTGMYDLDTKTEAFSEACGWGPPDAPCGTYGTYINWLVGGDGSQDDTSLNGFERVDVRVDLAKSNSLWTSSYNIECFAGWYSEAIEPGSGPAQLEVTYKDVTKTKTINPGTQDNCASTSVATITVYATAQGDGSFFEIT